MGVAGAKLEESVAIEVSAEVNFLVRNFTVLHSRHSFERLDSSGEKKPNRESHGAERGGMHAIKASTESTLNVAGIYFSGGVLSKANRCAHHLSYTTGSQRIHRCSA